MRRTSAAHFPGGDDKNASAFLEATRAENTLGVYRSDLRVIEDWCYSGLQ